MADKLRKILAFPYPIEYEVGYHRDLMKRMYKPLLVAVIATLLFVTWLEGICLFWPQAIAPQEYIGGLVVIHFVFMVFTIIVLLLSVGLRRQLFQYPRLHVVLCNTYAIGVCLWSSVLSAYADYSVAVYTAFVFVMLCVSMVALFKPWMAVLSYAASYLVFFVLSDYFSPNSGRDDVAQLYNAALAAVLGAVIAIAFYRFRTRTYYDRQVIAQQLEEIHQINHQLQLLIHTDNLTGFFNRRFYEESLPGKLAALMAEGSCCGVMVDIDNFKEYNDYYGHPAGDECLRSVARLIRQALPGSAAWPVRYGGEEFFLVAAVPSRAEALALAERARALVEEANLTHISAPLGRVTLSCGVAYCPKGGACTLAQLTQRADEALYASKQYGRNRVTEAAAPPGE